MSKKLMSPDMLLTLGELLQDAGVEESFLFGSFARGDEDRFSDIDILLTKLGSSNQERLKMVAQAIENTFGRKVDLVDIRTLPEHVRSVALVEGVRLLSKNKT